MKSVLSLSLSPSRNFYPSSKIRTYHCFSKRTKRHLCILRHDVNRIIIRSQWSFSQQVRSPVTKQSLKKNADNAALAKVCLNDSICKYSKKDFSVFFFLKKKLLPVNQSACKELSEPPPLCDILCKNLGSLLICFKVRKGTGFSSYCTSIAIYSR